MKPRIRICCGRYCFILLLLGIILGAVAWVFQRSSSALVTIRFAGLTDLRGGYTNADFRVTNVQYLQRIGFRCPRFSVTNHTAHSLLIVLESLEVQDRDRWQVYDRAGNYTFVFAPKNGSFHTPELKPHDCAEVNFVPVRMLLNGNCRLKVKVLKQVHGIAGVLANIRMFPLRLLYCYRLGAPTKAFSSFSDGWTETRLTSQVFSARGKVGDDDDQRGL